MTTSAARRALAHAASSRTDAQFERLRRMRPGSRGLPINAINPAWLTVFATLCLSLLGVYCIDLTESLGGDGLGPLASKQLAFVGLGALAAAVVTLPHYKLLGRFAPALCLLALGMLAIVLIPAVPDLIVRPRNGARRWISLGFTDFQPSEIAKIVYVIAVAWRLRYRENHRSLVGLIPPAVITFVPMGLIVVEPDLGAALLFLPALFAMLIAAGAKLKHLALVVVVAASIAPAMYPLLKPHQQDRIKAMYYQVMNDKRHADGINYQGYRAMTLVGAGGVDGLGDAKSRAVVHFNQLPEDHNDMIFAVVATRFGLLGGFGVMALYFLWIAGAVWSAAVCKDPFGRLLIVGLVAMTATQMTINIGETIGILPITGTTLPFVSYGGSSLVVGFIMVGLIYNVAMRRPARMSRRSFEFDAEDGDE